MTAGVCSLQGGDSDGNHIAPETRDHETMDRPWQIYYEEIHERTENVPEQRINRVEDMTEAAHEAYEATVDRLVNRLGHGEKDALGLTKAFGRALQEWMDEESWDWDELQTKLEQRQYLWDEDGGIR